MAVIIEERRLTSWCQDGKNKVPDPEAAKAFIERVGFCTLYPASSEVPNLLHAYVGDPGYKADAKWDSPAGHVYTWRWELGKVQAAFYGVVVAKKPTWVAWKLLPTVLAALMEPRHPEELYELGELTADALRIAQALDVKAEPMSTDELRTSAGFPTGKAQRNAYLKALEELELKLIVAKHFDEAGNMLHVLVDRQYPEAARESRKMDRATGLATLMGAVLPQWIYVDPKVLARGLRIPEQELIAAIEASGAAKREGKLFVATASSPV